MSLWGTILLGPDQTSCRCHQGTVPNSPERSPARLPSDSRPGSEPPVREGRRAPRTWRRQRDAAAAFPGSCQAERGLALKAQPARPKRAPSPGEAPGSCPAPSASGLLDATRRDAEQLPARAEAGRQRAVAVPRPRQAEPCSPTARRARAQRPDAAMLAAAAALVACCPSPGGPRPLPAAPTALGGSGSRRGE